jgi:MoaA/NifB/PqqE/SkfB family radical SAM enzyme
MCDIWKSTDVHEISADDLNRHLESIEGLGVKWVVLTGGEALMHSDLFRLCALIRDRRIRVTLLSTGLLLARHAENITRWIDDVIVSLDGPSLVHDQIRRVPGAFEKLAEGVAALRTIRPGFPITARCTVQRLNCGALVETVAAARAIRLDGISFLAVDVTSDAFNRAGGWEEPRQSEVALTHEKIRLLTKEIERLIETEAGCGFVVESPDKLMRIVSHFRSHLGEEEPVAPLCNAPWVSAFVEADGTVRPCFFQPPIGRVSGGQTLLSILQSKEAAAFRDGLDVPTNPICKRCVCSLNWKDRAN